MSADIGDLAAASPEELLTDPGRLRGAGPRDIAARALAYAHATGARNYDEIGFRWAAALPLRDEGKLQTVHRARVDHARELSRREDPRIERARRVQPQLEHRPIEPPRDGRFSFGHDGRVIRLLRHWNDERGSPQQDQWTFALSAPPPMLLERAGPHDAAALAAHSVRGAVPGMRWLPLATVIERSRFPRMQDCREDLVEEFERGAFYAFLSHRWLARGEPDPDGRQARYAAWQLVGHLCDALRVAALRGLDAPRLSDSLTGVFVGPSGTALAEALLVNLVRRELDDAALDLALDEITPLELELADFGAGRAAADRELAGLRALLAERPVLAALVARIRVWYDYSCLPQPPREPADEDLFVAGLRTLIACQGLGRTVVLLDDADDYLSRGWCTLEALSAEALTAQLDLLVGSERRTAREGRAEQYFEVLLQDRPHIVWRALLDTEVHGVQSPDECLSRLGLGVTEPRDVPFIYERLCELSAPRKLHTADSELWTGVVPLPVSADGTAIVPRSGPRAVGERRTSVAGEVDSREALRPAAPAHGAQPPYVAFDTAGCHVAVIGSCEGECLLLAEWVLAHRDELTVPVASLSWLATDIAPVGELPCGSLRAESVASPLWVLVGSGSRLARGVAGPALAAALNAAGLPHLELEVDRWGENLTRVEPAPDPEACETVPIPADGFPIHTGGLVRAFALEELV